MDSSYKPLKRLKLEDRFDEPCDEALIEKANAGDQDSQLLLALEFATGRKNGIHDYEKVYEFIMAGRSKGLPRFASYLLSGMRYEGLGVAVDKEAAERSSKSVFALNDPPLPPTPEEWIRKSLEKLSNAGYNIASPIFLAAAKCREDTKYRR
jgi:hypothetical protein